MERQAEIMIDFAGQISGEAEKHFLKRTSSLEQVITLVGMCFPLPIIVFLSLRMRSWMIFGVYAVLVVLFLLMLLIPKSKKERQAITPKRIYLEYEEIICVTNRHAEARKISDVKYVRDYGAFYELGFPFGKISRNFICQKDLLVNGMIEEFESLFEDKIVRISYQ